MGATFPASPCREPTDRAFWSVRAQGTGRRASEEERDEWRGHGLDVDFDGAGALDDAGARVLLRGAGPLEERAQYADDERGRAGLRGRHLGRARLHAVVRAG